MALFLFLPSWPSIAAAKEADNLFCIINNYSNSDWVFTGNQSYGPFYYIDSELNIKEEHNTKMVKAKNKDYKVQGTNFKKWRNRKFYLYSRSKIVGTGHVVSEEHSVNDMSDETVSAIKFATNAEKKEEYLGYTKKVNQCNIIKHDPNIIKQNLFRYYLDTISKKYRLPKNIGYYIVNYIGDIDNDGNNEAFATFKINKDEYNFYLYLIVKLNKYQVSKIIWLNYYTSNYSDKESEYFFDVIDLNNDGKCEIINFVGPYYQESVSVYRIIDNKLHLIKKSYLITTS